MIKTLKNKAFAGLFAGLVAAAVVPFGLGAVHAYGTMFIAVGESGFSNTYVTLPVGSTVTWTNTGLYQHSVTADNGAFDSGMLVPNQAFTRVFNTPGTFTYHDNYYGGAHATIVIGDVTGGGAPICSPSSQFVNVNMNATLTATGGNGIYAWSAPNGSPTYGSGSTFVTSFPYSGSQTVTVTSNGYTSSCTVNVNYNGNPGPIVGSAPYCTASSQNVNVNDWVTFTAIGGNGSYYWLSADGSPSSGNGSTYGTRFTTNGTKTIVLTSNGQNAFCTVYVSGGSVLGVSTVLTGPENGALWALGIGTLLSIGASLVIFRKRAA